MSHLKRAVNGLLQHLREAQLLYNETRVKLNATRKELLAVSALIPARQRRNVGQKGTVNLNVKVDDEIIKQAKKFAVFYQFFLIDNLFPATPFEEIALNPEDPARWTSVDQKRLGMLAELYAMTPQSFHKHMGSYSRFAQLVSHRVFSLRLNHHLIRLVPQYPQTRAIKYPQVHQGSLRDSVFRIQT